MIERKHNDLRSLCVAAFIFENAPPRPKDKIVNHLRTVREIETRAQLNFLHRLPLERKDHLETVIDRRWVEEELK